MSKYVKPSNPPDIKSGGISLLGYIGKALRRIMENIALTSQSPHFMA